MQKMRKCLLEVSILHATRTYSPCETGKHVRSVSHHLAKPIFFFLNSHKDENVIKKMKKEYEGII